MSGGFSFSQKNGLIFLGFSCRFSVNNHSREKPNCGLRKPTQNQRWVSSDQIRETQKSETAVLPKITKFGWERFKKRKRKTSTWIEWHTKMGFVWGKK